MNVRKHNEKAWDKKVDDGNIWTTPVGQELVAKAGKGEWSVVLTPSKPVPETWFPGFPDLTGSMVLALASGGGQQGPILAAAGATVTVFDNSTAQLAQDRLVADRDDLQLTTLAGDMKDLSCFDSASFDLIFHPVSNCFVEDPLPYSDVDGLSKLELAAYVASGEALEFSHTMDTLVGGQLEAGFQLTGFYEDRFRPEVGDVVSQYMPVCFATRAGKPLG